MPPSVNTEHNVAEAEGMADALCRWSCSLCCYHDTGSRKAAAAAIDKEKFFPNGLRVLVVDDDTVCLAVLERMLRQCDYNVTACTRVSQAISLVMENENGFDIVMSDVYLPGEDGFKLLEVVGIGFDVPVIMMSANGETNVVMRSITGGACNHLIKPIRMEELRTIWQHVVRRHAQQNHIRHKVKDSHGDLSDHGRVLGELRASKKRKHSSCQFIQEVNSLKTARVHWTDHLHRKFVKAVNQTGGVDNASPKRIQEIMNVPGLTRQNVASHLQKYRLYLKRLHGSIPQPRPVASFQAAKDGKSGGTMQIRERDKTSHSSSTLSSSSSASKAFSSRLELERDLDCATLKLLQQFQANEQKLAANRAQGLRRLADAAAAPSYRSSNVRLDEGYERSPELHIMTHVGWLRKNLQGGGGHRASPVHDSAPQSFKFDFPELDKTKTPPRLFVLSTHQPQIQNPSPSAKALEESNAGKEDAKLSAGESRNTDHEELLFNNFVEEEFHHVTVPPDHDQMPTLTAAACNLLEEYVILSNNFL